MRSNKNETPPAVKHQRIRCDRFFIQQAAVRRFRRDHKDDYDYLRTVRENLAKIIVSAGLIPEAPFFHSVSKTAIRLMRLYETRLGREAIKACSLTLVRQELDNDISMQPPVLSYDEYLEEAIRFLAENLSSVRAIQLKYNYFDYFSLIAMTALCPGETACRFWVSAAARDLPVYEPYKTYLGMYPGAYWFHTRKEPVDLDLAIALKVCAVEPRFYAENLAVFSDRHNHVVLNGQTCSDGLYLKIDLKRAPRNIDFAMRYLKECLFEALMEHHGAIANVPEMEVFEETNFMKNDVEGDYLLISQWNQVWGSLVGLCCWDLLNYGLLARVDAVEKIVDLQADVIAGAGDSLPDLSVLKEKAIEKHLKIMTSIIREDRRKRSLSAFVTGDHAMTLGLRL